jgi:hypothetical protein
MVYELHCDYLKKEISSPACKMATLNIGTFVRPTVSVSVFAKMILHFVAFNHFLSVVGPDS